MTIRRATAKDAQAVAVLFDQYRQFYECPPDLSLAEQFISGRLINEESIIFVSDNDSGELGGFVQLYPSFCSVEAIKILILYDLFVAKSSRGTGLGEALMQRAAAYAGEVDAQRLDLLTGKDNVIGQSLYEKCGYKRTNDGFYAYSLNLN